MPTDGAPLSQPLLAGSTGSCLSLYYRHNDRKHFTAVAKKLHPLQNLHTHCCLSGSQRLIPSLRYPADHLTPSNPTRSLRTRTQCIPQQQASVQQRAGRAGRKSDDRMPTLKCCHLKTHALLDGHGGLVRQNENSKGPAHAASSSSRSHVPKNFGVQQLVQPEPMSTRAARKRQVDRTERLHRMQLRFGTSRVGSVGAGRRRGQRLRAAGVGKED